MDGERMNASMISGTQDAGPHGAARVERAAQLWHELSTEQAFERLGSRRRGLSDAEVAERRARTGPNKLVESPPRSKIAMFLAQFADFMVLILLAAAIVSGVIGDLADTLVIAAVVVLNAMLGFIQELRGQRAMEALKSLGAPIANVIRNGVPSTIRASELVPGDVVTIEAGAIVPADLRLIESASLRIDESTLTGESVPIDKIAEAISAAETVADRRNVAHKGCVVTYGRGVGLVVATGMNTELGRIARLLTESRAAQTPLQRRLTVFGRWLAVIVLLICAVVFVTGLLRGEPPLHMFMVALSLAVAAIPEALVAVVSISLALGAHKMASHRALVRRLSAVETLGSVTFICSDKTGTLTANKMQAEQFYCDGVRGTALDGGVASRELLRAMAISHDAVTDSGGAPVGDPTEVALLAAAQAAGYDRAIEEARAPRIAELPFDSDRKCMTTVHRCANGNVLSITKGAAEVVIRMCVRELRSDGARAIERAPLEAMADDLATDGLRVLGVAVRHWQSSSPAVTADTLECNLDFVGLVGLIDPPRPEVQAAIATCKSAGIVPVMITGDHPLTARAVARRLGLLEQGDQGAFLTGPQLATLSSQEFERRIRDTRVYARVLPEQKVKIVSALQAAGEIVAMTGDGVNDAPALQRADIGVAMGVQGTDVAREASSIVLLDDNFATIVRAVREGRRIYDNLRRFVRYVLTTNSAEIWTIFLAPFLGLPMPLLPVQILWINLVTDGLPGLALAAEPAERDVMQRRPRPPTESMFAGGLGMHALLVGLLMAALTLGAEAWYVDAGNGAWQTIVFTTLCFAQLGHVLAIRSERRSIFAPGFGSNPALLATVALTIGLQLVVIYAPVFNALFKTVPLRFEELATCIGAAAIILAVVEIEKWARRRRSVAG
jgi:Ca2+-transporting ATPase